MTTPSMNWGKDSKSTPSVSRCACGRKKQLVQGVPVCTVCEKDKLPDSAN